MIGAAARMAQCADLLGLWTSAPTLKYPLQSQLLTALAKKHRLMGLEMGLCGTSVWGLGDLT